MEDFLKLVNRHTGETLNLQRVRAADGQINLTIIGSLPPNNAGPPPHIHMRQLEEGVVKSGTLGAKLNGKAITVATGESAVFPAGTVHGWWNAGASLLEFSGRAVPAEDLDRFLQAIFAIVNASATGQPSLFYLAHVLSRHWNTQAIVSPPRAVQRILFPVVLLAGRMLGKYAGDDWPGSPSSCTGAPLVPCRQGGSAPFTGLATRALHPAELSRSKAP